jgi:hypothetical protein
VLGYLVTPVATAPSPDLPLAPLGGSPVPLKGWLTTFHLVLVALDPFTNESAWILPTAERIMRVYDDADCRVAWLITCSPEEAQLFLGPLSREFLTFVDPDRSAVKALGLERLPAIVHIRPDLTVAGAAEGWDPVEWREITATLSREMDWSRPSIPNARDPRPFAGTPALG